MKKNIPISAHLETIEELTEDKLTIFEKAVFSLGALFLIAILVNAGWSYILLVTGNTEGIIPLGVISEVLHIHCLLCFT